MCSWVITPAALVFHSASSGEIHLLSGYEEEPPVFLCAQTSEIFASTLMFQTWSRWSSPIEMFLCHWFVFSIYTPGPCVPPPLDPPVCESLISALVAVQMALCWCFTMGLRSVCLMPSAHSNFSTPAVSFLFLYIYIFKWFSIKHQGCSCTDTWLYRGLVLRGSEKKPQL